MPVKAYFSCHKYTGLILVSNINRIHHKNIKFYTVCIKMTSLSGSFPEHLSSFIDFFTQKAIVLYVDPRYQLSEPKSEKQKVRKVQKYLLEIEIA